MPRFLPLIAFATLLLTAAACGGPMLDQSSFGLPGERAENVRTMLALDANNDGVVSKDELEQGQKKLFDNVDSNKNGRIDVAEMQAENDRRFRENGTGASPLIDWNRNSQIEFDEFATTARSLFAQMDQDQNGQLGPDDLRLPPPRAAGRGPGGAKPPQQTRGRGQGGFSPSSGPASLSLGRNVNSRDR